MTQEGLQLIMSYEGFRPKAYWDSDGRKWTIGYGTTVYPNGTPVRKGDTITKGRALDVLKSVIAKTVAAVGRVLTARVSQYQLDALTSFAYNCGIGNLKKSTLLRMVNEAPNDPAIRDEFARWVYSGGKVLSGLVTRRNAEADLYFKGVRPDPSSPTVRRLSRDFRERYGNGQEALRRHAARMRRDKAVRGLLSRDFRERYSNSPEMARWAERQRAVRDVRPNLSRDFRENYGSSRGLLRNAKADGGKVDEGLVGRVVAEVVSERLRGVLG